MKHLQSHIRACISCSCRRTLTRAVLVTSTKASFSNLNDMSALMFNSMDLESTGLITLDRWFKFTLGPLLDHSNMEQIRTFLRAR